MRRFVVVSGLPGSGKSTLGAQLAEALGLRFLDKDAILESLFESRGTGDVAWRRALSRESDLIFRAEAEASQGAVLVSHWHLAGMAVDSGTSTDWISPQLGALVHVHCVCPVEVAAHRFRARRRHAGHLDVERSEAEVVESFERVARLGRLGVEPCVEVDASGPVAVEDLVRRIKETRGLSPV